LNLRPPGYDPASYLTAPAAHASTPPQHLPVRYEQAQLHARLLEPGEIADASAYLASLRSTSMIGTALVVDGGYSIQ
jgi:NAD(P)-dependent dehydrogenase (short-subunit alcohol dehydrogenase family)